MKMDEKLYKKRGERLRECRTSIAGMTQERLAELCNCSVQHVSLIENGKRGLTRDFAYKFASILKTTSEYLLCDTDYKSYTEAIASLHKLDVDRATHFLEYLKMIGVNLPFLKLDSEEAMSEFDEFHEDVIGYIYMLEKDYDRRVSRKKSAIREYNRDLLLKYSDKEFISRKELQKDMGIDDVDLDGY